MKELPTWVKVIIAIVIFAALYGATELMLYLDHTASGKVGLD